MSFQTVWCYHTIQSHYIYWPHAIFICSRQQGAGSPGRANKYQKKTYIVFYTESVSQKTVQCYCITVMLHCSHAIYTAGRRRGKAVQEGGNKYQTDLTLFPMLSQFHIRLYGAVTPQSCYIVLMQYIQQARGGGRQSMKGVTITKHILQCLLYLISFTPLSLDFFNLLSLLTPLDPIFIKATSTG